MNKTDVKREFGKRLKFLRQSQKISQEKLAETIGINQQQISKIERGISFVTPETLSKISNALKTEIKDFFDFKSLSLKNLSSNKTNTNKKIEQIISKMPDFQLEQLYKIAEILMKRH